MAAEEEVLRCHAASHLAAIRAARPVAGWAAIDGDTFMAPGSWEAALRAVGGALAAVDAVLGGAARNAFLAMRPPGHHAERDRAMGFCMFSTVAIAASYALDRHGLDRVAVLDFDVHHGNGTQDCLWDEPRAMFVSSHQMPLYPGTGYASETGAHGQMINLPLVRRVGRARDAGCLGTRRWPASLNFHGSRTSSLISAGFDAHARRSFGRADVGRGGFRLDHPCALPIWPMPSLRRAGGIRAGGGL